MLTKDHVGLMAWYLNNAFLVYLFVNKIIHFIL